MDRCWAESGRDEVKVVRTVRDAYSAGWCVGNFGCVGAAHVAADGCANDRDFGGDFCKAVRRKDNLC